MRMGWTMRHCLCMVRAVRARTISANSDIGPSETLYLRVRACNAGGCGGYSAQQVADDYYPICV